MPFPASDTVSATLISVGYLSSIFFPMSIISEKPQVSNRITPVESTQMDASPAALCFIRNIRFDTLIKFFVL